MMSKIPVEDKEYLNNKFDSILYSNPKFSRVLNKLRKAGFHMHSYIVEKVRLLHAEYYGLKTEGDDY